MKHQWIVDTGGKDPRQATVLVLICENCCQVKSVIREEIIAGEKPGWWDSECKPVCNDTLFLAVDQMVTENKL